MSKAFIIEGSPSSKPTNKIGNAVKSTFTSIEFLLDETGSMTSVRDATISGFNEYLNSQKGQDGKCVLTLTKFDSTGIRTQYQDVDVETVKPLDHDSYKPNAMTNLYDAIGQRIRALEQRAAGYDSDSSILMVIMTDGEDNQSREFNAETIKSLIKDKESKGWTFVFLGANQDAWKVGQTFGMARGNTMTYDANDIGGAMAAVGAATTSYRSMRSNGLVGAATASSTFFAGEVVDKGDTK